MKRNKSKKLKLHKETIRTLSAKGLERANGGTELNEPEINFKTADCLSIINGSFACTGFCQ